MPAADAIETVATDGDAGMTMTLADCARRKDLRAYKSWMKMKERCSLDEKSRWWRWYGSRGIVVCERWRHSFANFFADMGERPAGMSLDRINTNGNYEPTNCRWATRNQQMRNRTDSIMVDGRSIHDLCDEAGIPMHSVYWRIHKLGMSPSDALAAASARSK